MVYCKFLGLGVRECALCLRYEIAISGTKYFTSGWAMLAISGIGLHIATIVLRHSAQNVCARPDCDSFTTEILNWETFGPSTESRYRHHQSLGFTLQTAQAEPGRLFNPDFTKFEDEADA